nr:protein kinase [Paenibacillus sp. ACRRX]
MLGNRYQIISIIGRGGMGTVYLAEDMKLKGKKWAVKETRLKHANMEHLIAEADLLTQLSHPYLPQIVDYYPPDADGFSYLVMDYIRGETLSRRYERAGGRMALSLILKYTLQVCDLYHYLHHELPEPIIYRDMKPSNIMIDENDNVRIIDFGIARSFKEGQQTDTVQLGTIGFAAPEQFENRQTDHRTDLYALGAVMYYLLSGGQYYYIQQKSVSEFNPDSPDELNRIVHKLLQMNPTDRYQSAAELKSDLRNLDISLERSDSTPIGGTSRTNGLGSIVIAVAGIASGVGSTHTSIMIAHMLAEKKYSVCLVEASTASDYEKIECVYEGVDYGPMSTKRFKMRGVEYIKSCDIPSMAELLAAKPDYIIYDIGYYQRSDYYGEFLRAHIPIVVGAGSEWRQPHIMQFYQEQQNADYGRWILGVPFASKQVLQDIQKRVPKLRVKPIPYSPDPFHASEDVETRLMEFVPLMTQESESLMKRWFKRR